MDLDQGVFRIRVFEYAFIITTVRRIACVARMQLDAYERILERLVERLQRFVQTVPDVDVGKVAQFFRHQMNVRVDFRDILPIHRDKSSFALDGIVFPRKMQEQPRLYKTSAARFYPLHFIQQTHDHNTDCGNADRKIMLP